MFNASTRSLPKFWLLLALCLTIWLAFDGATATAATPLLQPAAQDEAEWTILLYQDADDEVLEHDIMIDFNEAERVGSTAEVNIVAQVDRYVGAFDGMDDWTSTKRFYVTQDDDLDEIGSEELADLGEVNMADGQSLVDFIVWATQNFPARKYALIMSDHGAGWPGGWNDPDPGGLGPDEVAVANLFGVDGLWLMELDQALAEARSQTGIEQFELVGFDACLMSQLEVFTAIAPHARYSVASQEVEPALGWAYTSFLNDLASNPGMDGAELSRLIVESYIDQDQRIVDDAARQIFVRETYGVEEEVSAAEVAEATSLSVTLTAVDLAAIASVNAAVDELAAALVNLDPQTVAEARAYAQPFESVFGDEYPSPYIDLGHFVQLVVELTGDSAVAAAAETIYSALNQAIIAEKHGDERPGSTGLAIHFPTSEIYNAADNVGYTTVADRFAAESNWDEFLSIFHTGAGTFSRPDAEPVEPVETEEPAEITEPAALAEAEATEAKPIELAPLTLSAEIARPGEPVTIQTEVSGDRLAYLYTFIGRFLPREDVLLIEDRDYLFADETKEINGVAYPVWSEETFSVEYEWEPTVYAISDGQSSVKALFEPATYDIETPTYAVDGIYGFASGGDPRFAKMNFRDGQMIEIFGFTGSITQAIGAPRQITPEVGDQFTVLERGDDLSLPDDEGREKYVREGGTLTFNGEPFTLETTPAPSGNYVVGVIAEDLDGNTYEQYEGLFVVNDEASAVDGFGPYVSEDLEFALLYPENWTVEENPDQSQVDFFDETGSALASLSRKSYPAAATAAEADSQAIQEVIDQLNQDSSLENLQFVTDVEDYIFGSFDAKVVDFAFDYDGEPYYGYIVAATPVEGTTYVAVVSALDAEFDDVADEFSDMLYSFDILISGVSKEQAGPAAPDLADELFTDDFSDPASGLVSYDEEQDWGRGYYTDSGEYVFELQPAPGAIYDYYLDQTLPDAFLLETSASYQGATDNSYGLVFQVQVGEESDDFYAFRISGDGFYTVEKTEDGQLVSLIDWTASSLIDQTEGAANLLTVEGQGDTYYLYINGQQVDSFTDDAYSAGTFGFMVDNYDEENPAAFTFDNLVVGTPATE